MKTIVLISFLLINTILKGQDILHLPDSLKPKVGTLKEELYVFMSKYSSLPIHKNLVYDIYVYNDTFDSNCIDYKVLTYTYSFEYKYIDFQYCVWEGDTVYTVHFDSLVPLKKIPNFDLKIVTNEDKEKIHSKLFPFNGGITGANDGFIYINCKGRNKVKKLEGIRE